MSKGNVPTAPPLPEPEYETVESLRPILHPPDEEEEDIFAMPDARNYNKKKEVE